MQKHKLRYCLLFLILAGSAIAQTTHPDSYGALKWRLIGPFRGGRAVAVAGIPGDNTTFYFGAVDGGIWKTTSAGVVWDPIFDAQNVASIGALATAPSDPKTLYAGTGESDIRSNLASGDGVYRSSDGGKTWIHVGLDDTRQISRIVVASQDPNVVYVGALGHAFGPNEHRGVFKSVDGGGNWTKVLDQGPQIGVSDLTICSGNSQLLFAGTWNARRPPWSTYGPTDGPGGGLFRSQDAGNTWVRLSGKGLPEGDWGRVGVEVAADGKRVYALIQAKKSGLYRSDDGGDTWNLQNDDPRLTSRAWYFNRVTVDPQNQDVIYIPNVALYRSEDGGKTISVLRGAPGGDDYHQIWIDPKNSASMVLGTDQGTTISLDRGKTWSSWYNQPTGQLYHVTTDNLFPYAVYGAQQDSGTAAVPSRTDHGQITPRAWFPAGPSESGYLAVDPNDSNIVYLTEPYGKVDRFDRRTGLSQDISPGIVSFEGEINQRKYRAPWSPVLAFPPAPPGVDQGSDTSPKRANTTSSPLYFGTQYVMRTLDGGLHWEQISPDLTKINSDSTDDSKTPVSPENARQRGYGVIATIAPSGLDKNLIWAGSDSGLIHLTRDGGRNWKDVTPPNLSAWSEIGLIEPSHFDPATAYATVDRSRLDDQTPYLYRTRDYGASWQLITRGLHSPSFLRVVREDPQTRGLLFAGTEFGVYLSFDDGDDWNSLELNLPSTSVRDLAVHGDDLIAATHGRSFWILDNITALRQRPARESAKKQNLFLFRPATAVRIDNDDFPGTPLPPEEPTAENPPSGAMIDYTLSAPANTLTLQITDAQGNLVRTFSSDDPHPTENKKLPVAGRWLSPAHPLEKIAGMHRFVWDLKWTTSGGPPEDDESPFSNPSGPKVAPGKYQVKMTADAISQTQLLDVVMDPRSTATSVVLARQQQLGREMFAQTNAIHGVLKEIDSMKSQLLNADKNLNDKNKSLKSALADAQTLIDAIVNGKGKLAGKNEGLQAAYKTLASVLVVVETSDREIPSQMVTAYQEAAELAKSRIEDWKKFRQNQLAQLSPQLPDNSGEKVK
jgi:photosystem II stability/assembly factor-like uncharacterized protein